MTEPALMIEVSDEIYQDTYGKLERFHQTPFTEQLTETTRIQQEIGIRALPPILELMEEGKLSSYEALSLAEGIDGSPDILHSFYKYVAASPRLHSENNIMARNKALYGALAFSSDADEFGRDVEEILEASRAANGEVDKDLAQEAENAVGAYDNFKTDQLQVFHTYTTMSRESYWGLATPRVSELMDMVDAEPAQEFFDFLEEYNTGVFTRSLDQDTIFRILKSSRNPPGEASKEITAVDESNAVLLATEFYESMAKGELAKSFPLDENDAFFVESVLMEMGDTSDDTVDARVVRSQLSALHALIFSGGLDVLYRKHREGQIAAGADEPENEETKLQIKTQLAYQFLETVRLKNNEETHYNFPSGVITVGTEVEYKNFIERMLINREYLKGLSLELEIKLEEDMDGPKRTMFEKAKRKVDAKLAGLENAFGSRSIETVKELFNLWEPGVEPAVKMGVIGAHGSYSANEVVSNPSASYKTQLRELIAAASVGGLASEWGIHETFGGVLLTREHTEFMESLPICVAAGFVDFTTAKNADEAEPGAGQDFYFEKHQKTTEDAGFLLYFPFYQGRFLSDRLKVMPGQDAYTPAVQVRSIPAYKKEGFGNLVRQTSFQYYFAHGVKSVQRKEDIRNGEDKRLVGAYDSFISGWTELLASHGITPPENDQKYFILKSSMDTVTRNVLKGNRYLWYISNIQKLAKSNPEFVADTRKLIRGYRREVKSILGLSS